MKIVVVAAVLTLGIGCTSEPASLHPVDATGSASQRGLCVVDSRVAWRSGSGGFVSRTTDRGATWNRIQVPGSSELDFRDVEALDADRAWLLSIGSGAASRIYATTDGGKNWREQLRNPDETGFLDGLAFWDDRHGVAYGDPVNGRFAIWRTDDGGATWLRVSGEAAPRSLPGEAGFAASGTGIAVAGDGHAWICTGGGGRTRVLRSSDFGQSWTAVETPLPAPESSAGGFSIAFRDALHGVLVGGDYLAPKTPAIAAWSDDGGRTWHPCRTLGHRACVAYQSDGVWYAVGRAGADQSLDDGRTWHPWLDAGFYAIDFSGPDAGWAVGAEGRVAKFYR